MPRPCGNPPLSRHKSSHRNSTGDLGSCTGTSASEGCFGWGDGDGNGKGIYVEADTPALEIRNNMFYMKGLAILISGPTDTLNIHDNYITQGTAADDDDFQNRCIDIDLPTSTGGASAIKIAHNNLTCLGGAVRVYNHDTAGIFVTVRDNEYEALPGFTTIYNNGGPDSGTLNSFNTAFEFRSTGLYMEGDMELNTGSVNVENNTCNMHQSESGITNPYYCYYVGDNVNNSTFRFNQGVNTETAVFYVGTAAPSANCYTNNQVEPLGSDTLYSNPNYAGACIFNSTVQATHFNGGSAAPMVAVGGSSCGSICGLGNSVTRTITGNDVDGEICVTPSTSTGFVTYSTAIQITWTTAYTVAPPPFVTWTPSTAAAQSLGTISLWYNRSETDLGNCPASTGSTANICSMGTQPTPGNKYCWIYHVFGN